MANYQETTVSGESYVRCNYVKINNGMASKIISFQEEKIINLEDETIIKNLGSVSEEFKAENAATEFPLLNPETGEDTGATMSYQNLYVGLYSLYLYLAQVRDAAEEPAPAE